MSNLIVSDSCISCGICSRYCPKDAIEFKEKRPTWIMERCDMCLRCQRMCPKGAISVKPDNLKVTEIQSFL